MIGVGEGIVRRFGRGQVVLHHDNVAIGVENLQHRVCRPLLSGGGAIGIPRHDRDHVGSARGQLHPDPIVVARAVEIAVEGFASHQCGVRIGVCRRVHHAFVNDVVCHGYISCLIVKK